MSLTAQPQESAKVRIEELVVEGPLWKDMAIQRSNGALQDSPYGVVVGGVIRGPKQLEAGTIRLTANGPNCEPLAFGNSESPDGSRLHPAACSIKPTVSVDPKAGSPRDGIQTQQCHVQLASRGSPRAKLHLHCHQVLVLSICALP